MNDTFIVIPAYNEEKYIRDVVSGAKKYGYVIVVDDGSTDATGSLAYKAGAKVFKLSKNKGKGYALRLGAKKAVEMGAEILVFMDADGQHRPEDIPEFISNLANFEIVVGVRKGKDMPPLKKLGNWGILSMFRFLFHSDQQDILCGFKAMKTNVLDKIMWKSNDYFVETEIASKLKKLNVKQIEIPTIYLDNKKGTSFSDGLKIGKDMLLFKLGLK